MLALSFPRSFSHSSHSPRLIRSASPRVAGMMPANGPSRVPSRARSACRGPRPARRHRAVRRRLSAGTFVLLLVAPPGHTPSPGPAISTRASTSPPPSSMPRRPRPWRPSSTNGWAGASYYIGSIARKGETAALPPSCATRSASATSLRTCTRTRRSRQGAARCPRQGADRRAREARGSEVQALLRPCTHAARSQSSAQSAHPQRCSCSSAAPNGPGFYEVPDPGALDCSHLCHNPLCHKIATCPILWHKGLWHRCEQSNAHGRHGASTFCLVQWE